MSNSELPQHSFDELIINYPCLYNREDVHFFDRSFKQQQQEKLYEDCCKQLPTLFPKEGLKQRVRAFRTKYNRHRKCGQQNTASVPAHEPLNVASFSLATITDNQSQPSNQNQPNVDANPTLPELNTLINKIVILPIHHQQLIVQILDPLIQLSLASPPVSHSNPSLTHISTLASSPTYFNLDNQNVTLDQSTYSLEERLALSCPPPSSSRKCNQHKGSKKSSKPAP